MKKIANKKKRKKDDINEIPPILKYIGWVFLILVALYLVFFWTYTPSTHFPSYRPK